MLLLYYYRLYNIIITYIKLIIYNIYKKDYIVIDTHIINIHIMLILIYLWIYWISLKINFKDQNK